MTSIARPQPIGLFPLPATYLLLPSLPDEHLQRELVRCLMSGATLRNWPEPWRFFSLALSGDTEDAASLLCNGGTPLDRYNAFVLSPATTDYLNLRGVLSEPLKTLLDVVAYSAGILDDPPDSATTDGELFAMVCAAHAAYAIAQNQDEIALDWLDRAIEGARPLSALLAAQLLSQQATLLREKGDQLPQAIQKYLDALQLTASTEFASVRAELWLELGTAYQLQAGSGRGQLLEAVKCYQSAIQCGLSLEHLPHLYAHAHAHIGLAYLTMPMHGSADRLRTAVAIQSFREALRVYSKDVQPQLWATTQLNLANAYQYLPSSHPQENLIEAVKIYDDVLTIRNRASDPLGYARTLLNQSNALAHLGMFSPALEKLTEARKLFLWHEEQHCADAATELIESIHDQRTALMSRALPLEGSAEPESQLS